MQKGKETKITLMAITTTLSIIIMLFAPLQQAYSLSKYVLDADNSNLAAEETYRKIYQPLEQDLTIKGKTVSIPTTTSNSSIVPVGCAMDTIESLQSFLSCLGAK